MNTAKSLLSLSLSLLALVLTGVSVLSPTASSATLLPAPDGQARPVATNLTVGPTDGILAPGSTATVPLTLTHTGTVPARARVTAIADDTALSRAVVVTLHTRTSACQDTTVTDQSAQPLVGATSDWVHLAPGQQLHGCAVLHLPTAAGNAAAGSVMQLTWQAQSEQRP